MCKLNQCNVNSLTPDGYCHRHKVWSKHQKYIVPHLKKYIDKVKNTKGIKNKVEIVGNLLNYLNYKIEFLNLNEGFKTVILQRCEQIENDCKKQMEEPYHYDHIQIFFRCLDQINQLRINLGVLKD